MNLPFQNLNLRTGIETTSSGLQNIDSESLLSSARVNQAKNEAGFSQIKS